MQDANASAGAKSPASMQRRLRQVVIVLFCAVVLYFALALFSGFKKIGNELALFSWWTFAAALGLAFGNYLCRFLKWQYYLRILNIRGIPPSESFLMFLSGFVLSVTPGKIGEVFKSYVLHETHGVPAQRTAPIVIADRLTDLIGIIVLIAVGSTRFKGGLIWAGFGALFVSTILVTIVSRRVAGWLIAMIEWLPGPGKRLGPKIREAYEHLRELTTPSRLILPTFISIGAWFLECLALWTIVFGFHHPTSVLGASFSYATATLAGALIPIPGGLGITEGVMRELLSALCGVESTIATGAMILVRFATLWFAVLVGFAALSLLKRKYPKLLRAE